MVVCYITWHTNTHIILLFYVWDYLYTYYAITFFDFFWPTHFRLVHVIWDFRQWDVMTKVRYHLMVPIYNLRTLEVEHDLETCQRPWSTYLNFDPMGVSRAQKLKMKHEKITYFRHHVPWTKNPRRHEQG